ncbi:MAG: hypothetical protein ACOH5I_10850 [Oligoflexus sp.]
MLELSLPGGGLWGLGLTGFLYALRDRELVPDIVSAVSSGNHAAYLAYSSADYHKALSWFQTARSYLMSKPIKRFFPPYDMQGDHISRFTSPFMVDHSVFRELGLKHFYVGYVNVKSFRFIAEDILPYQREDAYRVILKSSTIPFLTNFVPHFDGGIDGGFRTNNFSAPIDTREKWIISYGRPNPKKFDQKVFKRRIILPEIAGNPLRMSDSQMKENFEKCYEFGATLRGL